MASVDDLRNHQQNKPPDTPNGNASGARASGGRFKEGAKGFFSNSPKMFAGGAILDTAANMQEGDNFGVAATKGVATGMLWHTAPALMTAHMVGTQLAPAAIAGAKNWKRNAEAKYSQNFLPNFGGQYQDTQKAQTMRQAGVQAIQGSRMNARSALGGEAKILHQGMHRGR